MQQAHPAGIGYFALADRFLVHVEYAGWIAGRDTGDFVDTKFLAAAHPAQTFLQQARRHVAHRLIRFALPAHRAAIDEILEVIALLFHTADLIAHLRENTRHGRQAHL